MSRKITAFSLVYFRSRNSSGVVSVLSDLRRSAPSRLIICGDFNAHHLHWGSGKTTARRTSLAQDLVTTDLCLGMMAPLHFFRPPAALQSIDLTFHSPNILITWEAAPDTQGSDQFPITIRMDHDHRFTPKYEFFVVRWDFYRTLFQKDTKPIEQSILANLNVARIHLSLPVDFQAPDLKYANLFAARRFAQRRYRRFRRREDGALFQSIKFSHSSP